MVENSISFLVLLIREIRRAHTWMRCLVAIMHFKAHESRSCLKLIKKLHRTSSATYAVLAVFSGCVLIDFPSSSKLRRFLKEKLEDKRHVGEEMCGDGRLMI